MDRHAVALTLVVALASGVAFARPRRHSHRNHTGGEARAQAPRKKSGEQASLHVRVMQLSATVGRGFAADITLTL